MSASSSPSLLCSAGFSKGHLCGLGTSALNLSECLSVKMSAGWWQEALYTQGGTHSQHLGISELVKHVVYLFVPKTLPVSLTRAFYKDARMLISRVFLFLLNLCKLGASGESG